LSKDCHHDRAISVWYSHIVILKRTAKYDYYQRGDSYHLTLTFYPLIFLLQDKTLRQARISDERVGLTSDEAIDNLRQSGDYYHLVGSTFPWLQVQLGKEF